MAEYAILDGNKVVNVIVASSKEVAAQFTEMTIIEIENGVPGMAWTLEQDGWRHPSPYFSWIWNGSDWEAPVPMPTLGGYLYSWNEDSKNWDAEEIPSPFPSWIKDENNNWIAPVPYPEDGELYSWDEDLQEWTSPRESEFQFKP